MNPNDNSEAPLKVTINGQEYDPTEAQALIETGQKTREYEKQWNTSLDKVWPEFGRKSEQVKTYETQLQEAQRKIQEYETKKANDVETPQDTREAQEAARKLGIVLKDDVEKAGYVKKDDLESWFEEKYTTKKQQDQAVEAVLHEADKLAGEIDGKDGRPKFNKRAVMAYASAYNKASLMEAYEEMNEESLAPWKDAQIKAQQAKSLKTLKPGGAKEPTEKRVNSSNFGEALSEAMYGTDTGK